MIDDGGKLTGVFTLRDMRLALVGSAGWGPLAVADDLATRPVLTVTADDDLHTALRRMTELKIDEIPVVEADDPPASSAFSAAAPSPRATPPSSSASAARPP